MTLCRGLCNCCYVVAIAECWRLPQGLIVNTDEEHDMVRVRYIGWSPKFDEVRGGAALCCFVNLFRFPVDQCGVEPLCAGAHVRCQADLQACAEVCGDQRPTLQS